MNKNQDVDQLQTESKCKKQLDQIIDQHRYNSSPSKRLTLITIEGVHGSGKTTLIKQLQAIGIHTIDELFCDMPKYHFIQNQSLVMEQVWVAQWFNRLLNIREQMTEDEKLIVADRSPLSAIYYSKANKYQQKLLEKLIRDCIQELQKSVNDRDVLLKRIQQRLILEPFRKQYNEDDPVFLQQTIDFYDSIQWDYIIYNDDEGYNDEKGFHTQSLINKFNQIALSAQQSW